MAREPRIAFAATYTPDASDEQDALRVLLIGTVDPKGVDWRYITWPLKYFERKVGSAFDPFEIAEEARFHDGTGDDRLLPASSGEDEASTGEPPVVEINHVSVLAVYPAGSGAEGSRWTQGVADPIARLDTVAFARDGAGKLLDVRDWRVSRARLMLRTGKGAERGHLRGFDLRVFVRMPLGAHAKTVGSTLGDRFDPRLILRMTGQRGRNRSLWKRDGEQVLERRGAACDEISLTATTAPWSGAASSRDEIALTGPLDLIDFAKAEKEKRRPRQGVDYVPLLSVLGVALPRGGITPVWGFRVADCHEGQGEARRVILRAEFEIESLGKKVSRFFPPGVGPVGDPRVWFSEEQRVADVGPSLRPRETVHWIVALRLDGTSVAPPDSLTQAVVKTCRDVVDKVHESLRRVRDGQPLSLLPRLSDPPKVLKRAAMPWHLVGLALDREPHVRRIAARRQTPTKAATDAFFCRFLSYEPRFIFDMWDAEADMHKLDASAQDQPANPRMASLMPATFRGLVDIERERPKGEALILAPIRRGMTEVKPSTPTRAPAFQAAVTELDFGQIQDEPPAVRFGIRFTRFGQRRALGLGAFLLELSDTTTFETSLSDDTTGLVVMRHLIPPGGRDRDGTTYPDGGDPRLHWGIEARLLLPVARLLPFEQDDLPEGARQRRDETVPLLLDMTRRQDAPDGKVDFTLSVDETVTRADNQSVRLSVRATRGAGKAKDATARGMVLVLDAAPFRVAGVEFEAPESAASDESSQIAVWNPDGENGLSWRVRDDGQSVRMILPPQVIGEAMEKNPAAFEEQPQDIMPDRAAAMRFGAASYLEVDPTYAGNGFREPGWNLRRIMGYVGQRSPGSRLKDLRLELVYGLTTRARPPQSVEAWITELAGAVGRPMPPIEDVGGSNPALKAHLVLSRYVLDAEKRRLAVDRLWSGRPDAVLRLEDGISFQLRVKEPDPADTAKSRPDKGPSTRLRWPVAGGLPDEPGAILSAQGHDRLKRTFASGNDDRDTFPGGVAWAFESANIVMSVYADPVSDGGSLADAHVSAYGGYGAQRALFDARKTVIETETAQGRTHRYKLERIGRIGALWHRAKHVIVYERTCVPSAQFFNRLPIGLGQDEHCGRPILRKLEEYVEILQPSRRYPENGTAVAAAGCLVGADFNSRRIRVDSRWGEDVRREGWRVPLWSRAFATAPQPHGKSQLNPDDPSLIYPKPQVCLVLAGEGGGDIRCEVDEPEKLFFYTSVVKGESGDDTDSWRPVRDVDFVDLPVPRSGTARPRSDRLTDAMLPAEPDHVPGYEQLTIGLVRSEEAARLTHGLLPDGPSAVLRNLTIARAIAGTASGSDAAQVGQILADGAADVRAIVDGALGSVLGALETIDPVKDKEKLKSLAKQRLEEAIRSSGIVSEIGARTGEIGQALGKLKGVVDTTSPCAAIEREVRAVVANQAGRLRTAATGAVEAAARDAMVAVVTIGELAGGEIGSTPAHWQEIARRLALLRQRLHLVFDEVRSDLEVIRDSTKANLDALQRIAGTGLDAVEDELRAALDAAIRVVREQIAQPGKANRQAALKMLRAAREVLTAAMGRLASGGASPSARRAAIAVDTALAAAIAHIDVPKNLKLALDAIEALPSAIEGRTKALGHAGRPVHQALDGLVKGAIGLAGDLVDQLQGIVAPATLGEAPGETLPDLIDAALAAIAAASGGTQDDAARVKEALGRLSNLVAHVEDRALAVIGKSAGALDKELDGLNRRIDETVDALVTGLAAGCNALEGFAGPLLAQLNDLAGQLGSMLDLEGYQDDLAAALADAVGNAGETLDDIRRQVSAEAERIGREAENRARQFAGAVQESIRERIGADPVELADRAQRAYQQGGETLRLLRAVGDPPKTDGLGLNRPAVAYIASQVDKVIKITPAIALVNRAADTAAAIDQAGAAAGDLLKSFGVRLPTGKLSDQFIPDKLKNLSLADLIPNMAGIDFRGLLQGAGFPDLDDANAIKITRGFDEKKLQAWMSAEIDVPLTEPTALLSFGPVEIVIDEARFVARTRLDVTPDGVSKSMSGRISGDWRVVTAGQDILTFRRTGLHFDESGRIDFKIDPERIELAPALEFVTNFLAAAGKGEGLVVEPLMRGMVPAGVAASLSTRLPDLQLGVFGISSLSLDVLFGVAAIPEFELLCDLSLSSRAAPFTLNVWILNGGGYITQRLSFRPTARPQPLLVYTLDVGIVAGVGLGFNFGVVSGGVWLQVGCSIAITWTTGGGGSTTAVTVFILARGNVDVCGLVTASISLLLEVTYDGARMIGAGTLRLRFKISMFYTLNVTQRVEYTFIGQKRETPAGNYSDTYA